MTTPPGFQSQRYAPPHPPQNSHTQSIAKLETQIGQLANAINRRDEGKLPSHPIENPRANYHEQAKAVITIKNGKLVDNKVGEPVKDSESNNNETKGISMTKIERKIEKELASSSNFKSLESCPTASYKPKFSSLKLYYHLHILEKTIKWKTY
ncbi:hypothetical protein M9H77_28292 [Catharanthus roseus]|uniref:Uncharacterized protein n=1 Tax=Catharanthus roseus TaxID=4058 RepID=A0ACC0AFB0_CATRO|nr:hypothetical protein M9H77_28292 [Catharanthus roseus]